MEKIARCLDGTAVVLDGEELIVTSFSDMEVAKEEYPDAQVIDDKIYSYDFSGFMDTDSAIKEIRQSLETLFIGAPPEKKEVIHLALTALKL